MTDACRRIWLVSGTGEGPELARTLLQRGWHLRVSVVSSDATRSYPQHPQLHCQVGPLGAGEALQKQLGGWPCRWLIDAAHPFAQQVHPALQQACAAVKQPLLRLQRPLIAPAGATVLPNLEALAQQPLQGEQLLLALGARQLERALQLSQADGHAVRLLPNPAALSRALELELPPERIACLRPQPVVAPTCSVEAALCRRWGITAVLARQSGGPPEQQWHAICAHQGLKLLLLQRPLERATTAMPLAQLLAHIGNPG